MLLRPLEQVKGPSVIPRSKSVDRALFSGVMGLVKLVIRSHSLDATNPTLEFGAMSGPRSKS